MVLLSGLPFDKSIFLSPFYEAYLEAEEMDDVEGGDIDRTYSSSSYKKELDRKAGRTGKPRSRISIDAFIAQSDGLGDKTDLNNIPNEE